jgi:deoxyuridine 5'-triphosphate nucleotidohydrolase
MARINDIEEMFRFSGDVNMLPVSQTKRSAGFDIKSNESMSMSAGECYILGTGVKLTSGVMGYHLELHPRSSLRFRAGCEGVGIIDSDYRDEIKMILYPQIDFIIKKDDRIGQLIPVRGYSELMDCKVQEVERSGGIGSTDK